MRAALDSHSVLSKSQAGRAHERFLQSKVPERAATRPNSYCVRRAQARHCWLPVGRSSLRSTVGVASLRSAKGAALLTHCPRVALTLMFLLDILTISRPKVESISTVPR